MSVTQRRGVLALAIVATAAVVALSLGNAPQLGGGLLDFAGSDKLKHATAYLTLAVLWGLWLATTTGGLRAGALFAALFALGALLEGLQWGFYPERFFELADMLANGVGAGLGLLIVRRKFPSP